MTKDSATGTGPSRFSGLAVAQVSLEIVADVLH